MVVLYYKSMVAGMKAAANIKNLQPPPYKADLSVNLLSYNLTGFLSVGCAGLMLLEQYAMRRVHCVNDPAPSTSEYCWHHGVFLSNATTSSDQPNMFNIKQSWILRIYMYFFIRAFFFIMPHLLWTLKFKNKIVALLQGSCDIINDLEESWVRYAETAEEEICKCKMVEIHGHETHERGKDDIERQIALQYGANMVMTKGVKEMTQARIPDYRPIMQFTGVRMAYDVVVHTIFLFMDISILLTSWQFDGTDFYCVTPWNGNTLQCMTPMLQILQQVMSLNVLCCGFMWIVMVGHTIWLAIYLLQSDTSTCFIESIPYAKRTEWDTARDRRTYKLMSIYLLQNFVVLHPLDLLKMFVASLQRKGLAGDIFVSVLKKDALLKKYTETTGHNGEEVEGAKADEVRQRKVLLPQLSLYDDDHDEDVDEKAWLKSAEV